MLNIGAVRIFTVKKNQCFTFINEHLNKQLKMNKIRAGKTNIRFGNELPFKLLKSVTVNTFFEKVNFYVIKTDILFLLLFKDINRLKIYFNNFIKK